jgi:phospholipid/cholesterol/gamma-HCH transport system ATP-binding protein
LESESPSADPIIACHGVRCAYGPVTILKDIDFEVQRGEVFVILGGSGCGKSTLLQHLIGLIRPAEGQILIDGDDLGAAHGEDRERLLRRFGVMFQSGALFSSMTLAENVSLPLEEFTDLPEDAIRRVAEQKLSLVALDGFEDHHPSEISGGMKKRAGVARALALDPPILFLDEPSAGLDPISAADLDQLILDLRDSLGATIVIVTHELDSIYTVADRCIVLDKARRGIVATGNPKDLRDHSPDPFVKAFFNRLASSQQEAG